MDVMKIKITVLNKISSVLFILMLLQIYNNDFSSSLIIIKHNITQALIKLYPNLNINKI